MIIKYKRQSPNSLGIPQHLSSVLHLIYTIAKI